MIIINFVSLVTVRIAKGSGVATLTIQIIVKMYGNVWKLCALDRFRKLVCVCVCVFGFSYVCVKKIPGGWCMIFIYVVQSTNGALSVERSESRRRSTSLSCFFPCLRVCARAPSSSQRHNFVFIHRKKKNLNKNNFLLNLRFFFKYLFPFYPRSHRINFC